MYTFSKFQTQSLYSRRYDSSKLGFQPLPGFIPKQDTWGNRYISGYEGTNEIYQDVPERAWTLIYVVKVLDPEDEPVTCGSLYKITLLNSSEIDHLGKTRISLNW